MNIFNIIIAFIKNLTLPYKIIGGVLVVGLFVIATHAGKTPEIVIEIPSTDTHVRVASVSSLSSQGEFLPVTGKVVSINKANILAVGSGEIVSLSGVLGEQVVAGQVIASFENSSQRAAVLQAQGAYDGATAALAKASGSTAENSSVSSTQAAQAVQNAVISANSALRSAYASLDDAVHTKVDSMFTNSNQQNPRFNISVPDSQLVLSIENERVSIEVLLKKMSTLGSTDSSTVNVDENITYSIMSAQVVESFLSDLVSAVNKSIPTAEVTSTNISTYQSLVGVARSETIAAIASLTAAKSAYNSALSSATIASNSANTGTANDIASAQANLKSALGVLDAAKANLEKTIIRAPISGTIVSLPISRGDYISTFTQVAQISNPRALEVVTYVTSDDAKMISVGGNAVIDGTTNGTIVSVAPALDPTTGKIQVKIGIHGTTQALTDGETVPISLARTIKNTSANGGIMSIPIVSSKITPGGPVVFTVSTSSTLVSNPVTFGSILGPQVMITKGISPEMEIVMDARGLSDGQKIIVDTLK